MINLFALDIASALMVSSCFDEERQVFIGAKRHSNLARSLFGALHKGIEPIVCPKAVAIPLI
jgi:hypothetical protein